MNLIAVVLDALLLLAAVEAKSVVVDLQRGGLPARSLIRRDAEIGQVVPSSDSSCVPSTSFRMCVLKWNSLCVEFWCGICSRRFSSYYSLMSFGNIDFRIALDTGSADLWLLSSDCKTSQCRSLPSYPLTYRSPSFGIINNNNTVFNLSFADSTGMNLPMFPCSSTIVVSDDSTSVASGYLASEAVQLDNFTIPNQVFGERRDSTRCSDH